MKSASLLILRLGLGLTFLLHGIQKAFGLLGGPGIQGFSEMLSGLGFAPAIFWAYLVAYIEFICGIMLIIGLITRFSSGLLLVVMLVAAIKIHFANGFFLSNGGYEFVFIISSICLTLILMGPGKISISKKY